MSFALQRGACIAPEGGVCFSVWAPRAGSVAVRVHARDALLRPAEGGEFSARVPEAGPGDEYTYVLDGELERPDPVSRSQPRGVHGPSRVVDPRAFAWSDQDWCGVARSELVIYELHVGTFTADGTFEAAIERLDALRELGVTALELMPVAEFPGARNWGYDGVFPYAPQSSYGGPEGLRRLVDAAHRTGLAVLLDVVYNHLGPEGNVLSDFGPYFTERYRTPWGAALDFDGADSGPVRRYFIDNALYWLDEFHLDGLRLDAVHEIYDASQPSILAEISSAAHSLATELGRTVHVIAESDANDADLVRPLRRGGAGLDGVWSDDFHHAVHAALTGETGGYYADFGGVAPIAKALRDRFVYDGGPSAYRGRPHGSRATDVPRDHFVVCAQNHDQVGNRAHGERLARLLPAPRTRLAAALVLLSPYLPLLFMGEEYAEPHPFLYFVDHSDADLIEAVRRGRRAEFAAFEWADQIPDPSAEQTFLDSKLDWDARSRGRHADMLGLYRDLLRLRREQPALRPGQAALEIAVEDAEAWLTALYRSEKSAEPPVWAAFHLGTKEVRLAAPGKPAGIWQLRLCTDDPAYGGRGRSVPQTWTSGQAEPLVVPPETAMVFVGELG